MEGDADSRLARGLTRVIAFVLDHRGAALVGLALVVLVVGAGALRLSLDFSSTSFYGESESAERLAEFQRTWGADDDVLLVLISPRESDDAAGVLSEERLATIAELSEALVEHEDVRSVRSIATAPLPRPRLELDLRRGPDSRGEAQLIETDLPRLVRRGLAQPELRDRLLARLPFVPTLLSADGRHTVIAVELGVSSDDVMRTRAVLDRLEPLLVRHDEALAEHGLRRQLAGVPAIRASFFSLVVRDQAIFIPLTLAIIALALLVAFRRVHGVLIPAFAAGVATFMLLGIMGWSDEPIGLLNQAYFTLLPVIAVADAIHMVARFGAERRAGIEAREAIIRAGSRVGLACLLTTLTTATGFASLGLASMPILRGFGLYAALGVSLAFVVVVVMVPLALSFVLEDRPAPRLPGVRLVDALVRFSTRRSWTVLVVTLGLVGAALIPAARVRVDNTLSGLLDADHPTSRASALVDDELGGVLGLELELRAEPGVDLRDPEHLAATHGFETWLDKPPEVRAVEGLASVVAATGPLLGGSESIPDERDEIDARLRAIEPYAPLERWVTPDGARLRIHAGMPDAGGKAFVAFAERAQAELRSRLGEGVEAHATGTALLAYRGVNRITEDLRRSLAAVFLVVVVVIGLLFRSPWPALVGLLPNGAPLLLGYALIGLLGIVLDPLAAVILTLALGIAVDDTLHILVRTREELAAGRALDEAVRVAIEHSGRAVMVTSIVIMGGLSLDLASSFPPLQMLGLLGTVVIGLALVMNLTVLPAVVVLAKGRGLRGT